MKNALVPTLLMSLSLVIPLSAWSGSEDAFRGYLPPFQAPLKESHQWSERKQHQKDHREYHREYREANHREKRNFREKDDTRGRPEKIGYDQHKPRHHHSQHGKHHNGHQPFTGSPHNLRW